LPDEPKSKMHLSFDQIVGTNVNNIATNSLGGVNAQVLVFCDLEVVEFSTLVKSSLIDCARNSNVDQLAHQQSIANSLEDGHSIRVQWKSKVSQILVVSQSTVDIFNKTSLFFIRKAVSGVSRSNYIYIGVLDKYFSKSFGSLSSLELFNELAIVSNNL
jgi:hypothetical protein